MTDEGEASKGADTARAARLKAALRENLRKRRARALAESDGARGGSPEDPD